MTMEKVDYGRPVEAANKLIFKFGSDAVILRQESTVEAGYESNHPWDDENPSYVNVVSYPCLAVRSSFGMKDLANAAILSTDVKLLIAREGLSIEPQTSDRIVLNGNEDETFEVISVNPVKPGPTTVLRTIQGRK